MSSSFRQSFCRLFRKARFVKSQIRLRSTDDSNFTPKLINLKTKNEAINFDTLGTWDSRIDLPVLLHQSIEHGKPIPQISAKNASCATVIGRRTSNQDRYKVKELQDNLLYFAVFDGHGGSSCADFCNANMECHILYWLTKGETDLQKILEAAFLELNNGFARFITYNMPNGEERSSGSTATVCLLRNSIDLVVGHVGDSRAILCRGGDARKLTIDHVPELKSEKERIIKSGGFIKPNSLQQGLVNGRLAMTRSLGDLDLKPYGVIPQADTRKIEIEHSRDAFIILTTDGINGVMSDQDICNAVNSCHDPADAASLVTDQAMQFGSEDNATAVIVPLGAWAKFRNQGNVTFNFLRNLSLSSRD